MLLLDAMAGWTPEFFTVLLVLGVYIVYDWVVSFWFQSPMFTPECGAWQ
jgi:hypothetical protein